MGFFKRKYRIYGHAPGDIAIATAMGEVLWDDFLKLEQMLLTQTKLSPEEQQIKKAFKSYDDNQILKIGPKDMHAEIRIVDSLQSIIETNNPNKVKNNIYIGISKLCCLECNLMLDAINACSNINVETRGAHNVSHNEHWTPPLGIPISKLKFLRVSAALHQVILNPLQKAIINYANARWKKTSELELKSGDRSEYAGRSVSPARVDIDKHIKDCRHVLDKNLVTAGCSDLNNLANQKLLQQLILCTKITEMDSFASLLETIHPQAFNLISISADIKNKLKTGQLVKPYHLSETDILPIIKDIFVKPAIVGDFVAEKFVQALEPEPSSTLKETKKLSPLEQLMEQGVSITHENQLGWNCFDLAVGINDGIEGRKKIVEYALNNANNIAFRKLLAPEIRQAVALTAVYLNSKKDSKNQYNKRIIELFQIADALQDKSEKQLIVRQAEKLKKQSDDLKELARNALPLQMHSKRLKVLVNKYVKAHENMRDVIAMCNDALGYTEGSRLPLEMLDRIFAKRENKEQYSKAYLAFTKARSEIYTPFEQALNAYCLDEDTYRQYIENYYGNKQWFAFQRSFRREEHQTSMVDIVARMLRSIIVIYQEDKEIYRTTNKSDATIHITYDGHSHFTARSSVVKHLGNRVSNSSPLAIKHLPLTFQEEQDELTSGINRSILSLYKYKEKECQGKRIIEKLPENFIGVTKKLNTKKRKILRQQF